MSYKCPHCGLFSPEEATRCDCGYDFTTKTIQSSYLLADTVRKHGGERQFAEQTARSNIRTGAIALAVAAVISAVSYIGSGRPSLFGGAAIVGSIFMYRGLRQLRALRR
jgi:precorrin-3B methylase